MNGYDLSRNFINFSFENPSKIKPNHYALYFFAIEHCNRLGWKKEYGLPTTMTMEAIGIKSYNTYINTFNELVSFGFFNCIERSKNQYSSNIIELSNNDKAHDKALDKAFIKHASKQSESTEQSIDSIDKPITSKQINNEDEVKDLSTTVKDIEILKTEYLENKRVVNAVCDNPNNKMTLDIIEDRLTAFNNHLTESGTTVKQKQDYSTHFLRWHKVTADIIPQKLSQGGLKVGDEYNGCKIVFFTPEGKPVTDGQPYKK